MEPGGAVELLDCKSAVDEDEIVVEVEEASRDTAVVDEVGLTVVLLEVMVAVVELLTTAVEDVARAVEVEDVAGAGVVLEVEGTNVVDVVWASVVLEVTTKLVVASPALHWFKKGAVVHAQAGHVAHKHEVVSNIVVDVGITVVDEEDVGMGLDVGAGVLVSSVGHSLKHREQSCVS